MTPFWEAGTFIPGAASSSLLYTCILKQARLHQLMKTKKRINVITHTNRNLSGPSDICPERSELFRIHKTNESRDLKTKTVSWWNVSYGGILLPPTCKINYVNIQHNYVNMRLIYIHMQHNYVDMHVINFCQKLFFSMGKFSY